MIFQIAEGGRLALFAGEEVLVDAQELGANGRMILTGTALQAPEEVALHGSGTNAFPLSQTASVDAVQLLLKDHLLETLTGSLERLDSGNRRPEVAATVQTLALASHQVQDATPKAPVIAPDSPPAPALVPQAGTLVLGSRYRPGMPGRYRDRAAADLDLANLELG